MKIFTIGLPPELIAFIINSSHHYLFKNIALGNNSIDSTNYIARISLNYAYTCIPIIIEISFAEIGVLALSVYRYYKE